MQRDDKSLPIQVQVINAITGATLTDVMVEAVTLDPEQAVVAQARTGSDGVAFLNLPREAARPRWSIRLSDGSADGLELSYSDLGVESPLLLKVPPAAELDAGRLGMLAEQLIATRMVRADDLASELEAPSPDGITRLFTASERIQLLSMLERSVQGATVGEPGVTIRMVDPGALRSGEIRILPLHELPDMGFTPWPSPDADGSLRPSLRWELFPWALPDDQSYRDYLRSVFVLFAHQQKLGHSADPKTFQDVVERQLASRFKQDFRTHDRTEVEVNKLLVPIVISILTASAGSGFGFGIAAVTLPAQGTSTNREYLDALLQLASIPMQEFANRYRLPLSEPDSARSTPVKLNIYTLSRVLSDTAQGPVEPIENAIEPQLPGVEGKPILWTEVVGSAPFFLRYDEWLARQQPFFPENLFAIRTQVAGASASGPWLNDQCRKYLEHHSVTPYGANHYDDYFSSVDEVKRSAEFLLAYGAADAKLAELVQAIDRSQFDNADRLVREAESLLMKVPTSPGQWEPEYSTGSFPRPLSFGRRRKLKVGNIIALTGTQGRDRRDGFERFFELERPTQIWADLVSFRNARDLATRLRTYQLRFLLPMLRATIRAGLGDLSGTVDELARVTGFYVGIAMLGTPAGMVKHPDSYDNRAKRVVAGRLRWDDPLGDRPYTARLMYDTERRLDGPFPLTLQLAEYGYDMLVPAPPMLHVLEERYARIVQADALLTWAEALYRTDDAASLERARELYKAVIFLHGEDPGTSAYQASLFPILPPWMGLVENPRVRNQIDRARLALLQLESGLNFYGYNEDAVPTLSYDTLVGAAHTWAIGAKSAQNDYLAYMGRMEQLDLDLLAAKALEHKARSTVVIAAEQVEIAKSGVVVARKLVNDVEKLIAAKQAEIDDAKSLFSQYEAYFNGMKSSISSIVDIGKGAGEAWTALSTSGVGEALGLGANTGGAAAAGSQSVGLGSAMGGLGVVGGFAAFAVLSTTTLQGMADAEIKREGELKALMNEALPAAKAAVRVQERHVTITNLHGQIAATDLAYARDLINYQNERFLNRDFWNALAGVARRSLHRYLDLSGQAAWFAERALAYRLAAPIRVIRLGYFDQRMRDIGGVDRLMLDLAELEALRLAAARVTVPLTITYSLARDLPLAFGQLKANGACTFTLSDDVLLSAYPGTFAHRIRAVDVRVDVPGTPVQVRGILTNSGFSLLRREQEGARVPLLRFADAYPISEFRVRTDLALHGLPGEHLLPFEGAAFSTTWTLEFPRAANSVDLNRIIDVRITLDLQAAYAIPPVPSLVPPPSASRAMFVSALALDSAGLASLRKPTDPTGEIRLELDRLALPVGTAISNLAVVLPGVEGGSFDATLRFAGSATTPFEIVDGLAMSNAGVLGDGSAANAQPLNAAVNGSAARTAVLTIHKGNDSARLAAIRDVLLWIEYSLP